MAELDKRELAPEIELERSEDDASPDAFDRVAFAREALARLCPPKMTVAVCSGRKMRVEAGRMWGHAPGERWAIVSVTPTASRRAIALAVAGLGGVDPDPWVLDTLVARRAS